MSVQQVTDATDGITCHAWNPDRTEVAVCPNNNELHIYDASTWEIKHQLFEHDLVIAGMDWSPVSNFIVTCSHDRNAFVWSYDETEKTWKPSLVILRIDRAALDVKWSPDGQKFAVASGAKCVPVCYYEADNNWWVSKMIKKHKSTVLCVAWHPNSQILATGSSDFKCRIFSAFVPNVDPEQTAGDFAAPQQFGEPYAELPASSWVHAVSWSPSGATLAYAAHDATIHFATVSGGEAAVTGTVRLNHLPLTTLLFVSERALVGAGHDFVPLVFAPGPGGAWELADELDKKPAKEKEAAGGDGGGVAAARAMWQTKAKTGESKSKEDDSSWKKHQSPITFMQPLAGDGVTWSHFSTSSLDGRLATWEMPSKFIK